MADIDIDPKALEAFAKKARVHSTGLVNARRNLRIDAGAFGAVPAGPELARKLNGQAAHVHQRLTDISLALDQLLEAASQAAAMASQSDSAAKTSMHHIKSALDSADRVLAGKSKGTRA